MKISIITVSWNVKEYLRRCLASLYQYAPSVPFEVIVVDNDSHDGSADMVASEFPSVKLIRNSDNRGFAKGCNQGAQAANGELLFFLNPDTEVTEGALEELRDYIQKHQNCGIVAPRIVEENGNLLYSIRRSPTPLVLLAILLKLQKFFPKLSLFKNYYAHDFDYTKVGRIEQSQGAALMIRKHVFDSVRGFDEQFYLWLDEVDLCKRIADKGYELWYTPKAIIMHAGGKSFKQKSIFERQLLFFQSSAKYLKKHFGWKRAGFVLLPMQLYILLLSKPLLTVCALGILAAEMVSYIGYGNPLFREVGFYGVVILTLVLTLIRLEYGVMILVIELIIGSKGHLFFTSINGYELGIRMVIFGIVFLTWLILFFISLMKKKHIIVKESFFYSRLFIPYAVLGIAVFLGIINGYVQGNNPSLLGSDVNGWFYFLAVFPFHQAIRHKNHIQRLLEIGIVALVFLIIKSLLALYILGHQGFGYDMIYSFYRWIRTTGVGEAAHLGMNVHRIFFQSHIYLLPALFLVLSYIATRQKIFKKLYMWQFLFIGVITTLLISFSRSFWIAGFITLLVFIGTFLILRFPFWVIIQTLLIGFLATLVSFALVFGITRFPIPKTEGGFDLSLLAQRFSTHEAALVSRWQALPVLLDVFIKNPVIGTGFGKEVTYFSKDPRVLEKDPTGKFTTYAFEWGYLDMGIKLGMLGLFIIGAFLVFIFRSGFRAYTVCKNSPHEYLITGLLFGLVALIITHIFTPYLNHPLGIGYLVFCTVIFERMVSDSRG